MMRIHYYLKRKNTNNPLFRDMFKLLKKSTISNLFSLELLKSNLFLWVNQFGCAYALFVLIPVMLKHDKISPKNVPCERNFMQ